MPEEQITREKWSISVCHAVGVQARDPTETSGQGII